MRRRFEASRFADLALPGSDLVDDRLADLAARPTSAASLMESLAARRLRREGVPVTNPILSNIDAALRIELLI